VWNSLPATVIAKFHYTDTDRDTDFFAAKRTRTDPTEFRRKKSPCPCPYRARVRVRLVEFSYKTDQFRQHLKTCLFGAQKSQCIVTFDYCALYEYSYLLTYLEYRTGL